MRIGAVITIAAGHDARNAASRPTMPVPAGSCPARIPGLGSDEKMKASDVEAAGQPGLTRPGARPIRCWPGPAGETTRQAGRRGEGFKTVDDSGAHADDGAQVQISV